jgi:hypothetical protein
MDGKSWPVAGTVRGEDPPPPFTDHPASLLTGRRYRPCREGMFGEACLATAVLTAGVSPGQSIVR